MRTLRIAGVLFVTVLKRRLAYRGDLVIQGLDELLRGLLALTMLHIYASKSDHLAGYTSDQLLFVVGFALTVVALFHCTCSNLYQLSSHYIINGNLDRILLRPYPSFLQICFDRLAIEDLSGAVLGGSVMAYAAMRIPGFDASLPHLALLAVLLASAFGVVVAVFMAFAATGFWFEDRVGMVPPVYNLMEFGRWPVGIYHWTLKVFIVFVIPFAFVAWYPASVFIGGHQGPWWGHPGLLTPVVAAVALGIASLMWRSGLRRYESSGS